MLQSARRQSVDFQILTLDLPVVSVDKGTMSYVVVVSGADLACILFFYVCCPGQFRDIFGRGDAPALESVRIKGTPSLLLPLCKSFGLLQAHPGS